jgi:DHA1 family tetracycline resistance protein-like MFS transporter
MKSHLAKNPLPVILFTIFIDLLGVGILIPVIPQLLANPHSSEYLLPAGYTLAQGYILLGFLTAIFPIAQFFATPILGQLSDTFGRRKILALSIIGTSLSYVAFAFGIITKNLPLLFFSRAFDGITGGNIAVAQAAVADITDPQHRARNFGLIGAAFGLGFIIGPYIGGKLSDPAVVSWFSASTPFWFAAALSFLNFISILLFFPETRALAAAKLRIDWNRAFHNIVQAFRIKGMRAIFTTMFLFNGGFTFYTTFFAVFLITKFNYTQGNIGDYFAYVGIWVAIVQAVITRLVAKKFSEYQVLCISIIANGLLIFSYLLVTQAWQMYWIVPFFSLFIGLTMANSTALISKSASAEIQGEVLGINASVQALAQSIPPIIAGYLAGSVTATTPLVVAGWTMLAAGAVFIFWYRPKAL